MRTITAVFLAAWMAVWPCYANPLFILAGSPPSTGGSFDKTGLVAWYDFDDATDAHASFDLTEANSPAYASGYGTAVASTSTRWTQASILSTFFASSGDKTFIIRFRPYGTIATGTAVMISASNGNIMAMHRTAGARARLSQTSDITAGNTALDAWTFMVVEYDSAAGVARLYVDGSDTPGTVTQAQTLTASTLNIGSSATAAVDVDVAVLAFFTRLLTQGERAFLYNSGGDITYADLN